MGLLLDGDAWLDLPGVGIFDREQPFSIGIWANIPEDLENGVLFHKGDGAAIYNFKGYHLALKNDRLELLLAHTAPYNAIIEYTDRIPRDQWIHLMITYDGSSVADGLRIYLNGNEQETYIESDHLYKDIIFNFDNQPEPGLQIGARWRGIGARGTIIDDIIVYDRDLTDFEIMQIYDKATYQIIISKNHDQLTANEISNLKEYFINYSSSDRSLQLEQLEKLRRRHNDLVDTIPEIMVIREMERPRQSHILVRGQYDKLGEPVSPNTPGSILSMDEGLPKNRLGLARWLTQTDHPLTARVAVNRLWQQFFGRGIVHTARRLWQSG